MQCFKKIIIGGLLCCAHHGASAQVSVRIQQPPPQYPTMVKASTRLRPSAAALQRPMPCVFRVETLPFFCKIEHQMAKKANMPIKLRLGDVPYVDYLEGK